MTKKTASPAPGQKTKSGGTIAALAKPMDTVSGLTKSLR